MKQSELLATLRALTARNQVSFAPSDPEVDALLASPPVAKYLRDLANEAKPETAAEDLFVALCREVLRIPPTRQVGVFEGYVDFMLPDSNGEPIPLELKPLFFRQDTGALRRSEADPKHHEAQIKKYLRNNEYLIFTDLLTVWCFSAKDFYFVRKAFAELPFADFLERCRDSRSILDILRRLEDAVEKPELEQQFFVDLKIWFEEFAKVSWTPSELAAESIILLINKLIFARTIEDFGLVPYRFTQDEYARQTKRWEAKGPQRIVPQFLHQFEEFFDEYYDTEIFSARILDRIEKNPANLQMFAKKLNAVLGMDMWDQVFTRGIVHYNYRRIDEDIFGKSYEMFLAANRKDEGIYYTPAGITRPMADSLVEALAGETVARICDAVGSQSCDFGLADELMSRLGELRVIDTACGSGGFLIKILRAFWRHYQRIEQASAWVNALTGQHEDTPGQRGLNLTEVPPNVAAALAFRGRHCFDNPRILIARLLLLHVFGVDKDPGALEVAKTNIWKEAVKLSPGDYNYRQLNADVVRILPNLELNFLAADSLVDVEMDKQAAWLASHHQAELRRLAALRQDYIANPMQHASLDEALALRNQLRDSLTAHFKNENLPAPPAAFALHFWPAWFTHDGAPRANPGFDGLIGNPPWESVKPVRKEFAQRHSPEMLIGKNTMPGPQFEVWFKQRLKNDAAMSRKWEAYEAWYENYKIYLSATFHQQGTGDWNYFKLFLERNLSLVRLHGGLSMLVPSSFQTDEGCMPLRHLFFTDHRLNELVSFENRGYLSLEDGKETKKQIFPDVDDRFKFGYITVSKGVPTPPGHAFKAQFYLHDPADVSRPSLSYPLELVRVFSPRNLSIVEFRSGQDMLLFKKLRNQHPLFGDLGLRFRRELHGTGDARFIHPRKGAKLAKGEMPMLEGRNIHQFDTNFAVIDEVVHEDEVREELMRKQIFRLARLVREQAPVKLEGKAVPSEKDKLAERLREIFEKKRFKMDYELPRLAYREIAASTNERTLIATIVPSRSTMNHKLMYLVPAAYKLTTAGTLTQELVAEDLRMALLAILNSLVANYYIRSRVSATVSAFFVYELPLPKLSTAQRKKLAACAAKLSADPRDIKERAALEAYIARELYGLSLDDWKHLTGTFMFGSGDSKAELDAIIRESIALWS